jgi:hypothetical protein
VSYNLAGVGSFNLSADVTPPSSGEITVDDAKIAADNPDAAPATPIAGAPPGWFAPPPTSRST